jgi:hypothetical protein
MSYFKHYNKKEITLFQHELTPTSSVLSSPTFGVFLGLVDKYVMGKTDKKIIRNIEKLLKPELTVVLGIPDIAVGSNTASMICITDPQISISGATMVALLAPPMITTCGKLMGSFSISPYCPHWDEHDLVPNPMPILQFGTLLKVLVAAILPT